MAFEEAAAKAQYQREMLASVERMKKELGYNPTLYLRMVSDYGAVGAAKRLFDTPGTSDGFTTLWERGRLDMTAEAHALLPWYADLFTAAELQRARGRLEEHGFDVDAHIAERSKDAPAWWTA